MLNTVLGIVMPYHTAEGIGEIHMTVSTIFKQLLGKKIIEEDTAKIKKGLKITVHDY